MSATVIPIAPALRLREEKEARQAYVEFYLDHVATAMSSAHLDEVLDDTASPPSYISAHDRLIIEKAVKMRRLFIDSSTPPEPPRAA